MTDEEIAKALGIRPIPVHQETDGPEELPPIMLYPDFSKPKWERKIKEKVREILKTRGLVYEYRGLSNVGNTEIHNIHIMPSARRAVQLIISGDSESAAWLEVLKFLTRESL